MLKAPKANPDGVKRNQVTGTPYFSKISLSAKKLKEELNDRRRLMLTHYRVTAISCFY